MIQDFPFPTFSFRSSYFHEILHAVHALLTISYDFQVVLFVNVSLL